MAALARSAWLFAAASVLEAQEADRLAATAAARSTGADANAVHGAERCAQNTVRIEAQLRPQDSHWRQPSG